MAALSVTVMILLALYPYPPAAPQGIPPAQDKAKRQPRAAGMPGGDAQRAAGSEVAHFADARSIHERRLPVRSRSLRADRAGARSRILPLHALPAAHGHGLLGSGEDRRAHVAAAARGGTGAGVAPSRGRL